MPAKGGYEPPLPLLSDMKGGDSFKVFLFFPPPLPPSLIRIVPGTWLERGGGGGGGSSAGGFLKRGRLLLPSAFLHVALPPPPLV